VAVALVATLPPRLVLAQDTAPSTRPALDGLVAVPDEIVVLAASSLTDVLPRLASAWQDAGGLPVRFSFDATSRLAPQVVQGARADVFFAADEVWMRWLEERGAVPAGTARPVAGNELVVVVPSDRGDAPDAAAALARDGPSALAGLDRLALAGENVPAGRYAYDALVQAGLWQTVQGRVVRGGSVRAVLEWVARGEVPAGVVYRTDALADPAVSVAFALSGGTDVAYWAAPLAGAPRPGAAADFLRFTLGPEGRDVLASAGFRVLSTQEPAAGPQDPAAQPPGPVASPGNPAGAEGQPGAVPSAGSAIRISLLVALMATAAGLLPAVGLGWLLARHEFPGKTLLSTAVLAPLVIPPVVTGFLLLSLLGTQSALGRLLSQLGLSVPFTLLGAAVAALVVGLPLYVISIRGAFEAVDPLYEELSWTLGVPPRRTFLRISLPLALPGIVAGAVLAFARALGEFGATVVLAGNMEGTTRTIALAVYTLLESPSGREATWVLVGASVGLSLLALIGFERLSRRQRRRLEDRHAR